MKKIGWMWLAGLAFASSVQAQKIEEVLQSVEQNNKELQAVFHSTEAAKMEVQTQNNLEDPSVEYSPFFAKGIDGMASSELVVTQGFDFPTLYAARNRSGKLQKDVLDRQQQALRRSPAPAPRRDIRPRHRQSARSPSGDQRCRRRT